MKKFFKTLLVALVLVPALCLTTACGGGGNGGGGDVNQQRYEILVTTLGKMAQKSSYTTTSTSDRTSTGTITNQTKRDGAWVNAEIQPEPEVESEKTKYVSTLNSATGEYVCNEYDWVEATESAQAHWKLNKGDSEYIVKDTSGEQPVYIYYYTTYESRYDSESFSYVEVPVTHAKYVSADHANHIYGFAGQNMEMTSMVNGETFAKAVENIISFVPLFTGMIEYGVTEDAYDITTTPTTTIAKNGNVYSLQISVTYSAVPKPAEEVEDEHSLTTATESYSMSLQGSLTLAITYTSEEITGYSSNMQMTVTSVMETESIKSTSEYQSNNEESATITYSYTPSEMPTSFADYPTDIEKADVRASLWLDGEEVEGIYFAWGEDANEDIFDAIEYVEENNTIENTHIVGWYTDKACTQAIAETDTFVYNSWEEPVFYAKSTPNQGYALLIVSYGYQMSEEEIAMYQMYGVDSPEDDFYALDTERIAIVATTGTFELPETYYYWGDRDVEKVTLDGTEITEDITGLQGGHTYQVKVFLDMYNEGER